jgi:hypothetical protein
MIRKYLFIASVLGLALPNPPAEAYTPAAVTNNTQLMAASTITYPGGLCRDTFGNGNGAPPQCYVPSNVACSLNAGAGDNGAQVKSADGKCWLAAFYPTADARQWGVTGNTVTDQTVAVQAALTGYTSGGELAFPCGIIPLNGMLTEANPHVTITSLNRGCAVFVNSNLTGDVLLITGDYSGVDNVQFQTASLTTYRTSGATIHLSNGFGFVKNVKALDCYICINVGTTGGNTVVDNVTLRDIANGLTDPLSAAILVNTAVIADVFIDRVVSDNVDPGVTAVPNFCINLVNAYATHIGNNIDCHGQEFGLGLTPGQNQSVQATEVGAAYFDANVLAAVIIQPQGTGATSGYVFDTRLIGTWLVGVASGGDGLELNGSLVTGFAVPHRQSQINGTKCVGCVIMSIQQPQLGTGVLIGDASPLDTTIMGSSIAGWQFGGAQGTGASHVSWIGNFIGAYSYFKSIADAPLNTNNFALLFAGSNGNTLVLGNHLDGNTTAPIQGPLDGANSRVESNIGFNPPGIDGPLAVGPSPAVIGPGAVPGTYYFAQPGTFTATVKLGGLTAGTCQGFLVGTLANGVILQVNAGPGEEICVTWDTTAPGYTVMFH